MKTTNSKNRMSWCKHLWPIFFFVGVNTWAAGETCSDESMKEGLVAQKTNGCILDVASGVAKSNSNPSKPYFLKISNYLPIAMNAYLVNDDGSWQRLERHWTEHKDASLDYTNGLNSTGPYTYKYDTGAAIKPRFLDINNDPDFSYHKNSYFLVSFKNVYVVLTDLVNGGLVAAYFLYDSEAPGSPSLHTLDKEGCACMVEANKDVVQILVNEGVLAVPNSIGGTPTMSGISPIPGDTMPILVGTSFLGHYRAKSHEDAEYKAYKKTPSSMSERELDAYNSKTPRVLTRHQYWSQTTNSLVVPAHEYVSFTTQTFYGTEDESSSAGQFSAALSMSAGAGYGPVSASISASLSASSNYSHSLTIQTSTTETVVRTIDNTKNDYDHIVQYFQLTDLITVSGWSPDFNAMLANAVFIQKNAPALPAKKELVEPAVTDK